MTNLAVLVFPIFQNSSKNTEQLDLFLKHAWETHRTESRRPTLLDTYYQRRKIEVSHLIPISGRHFLVMNRMGSSCSMQRQNSVRRDSINRSRDVSSFQERMFRINNFRFILAELSCPETHCSSSSSEIKVSQRGGSSHGSESPGRRFSRHSVVGAVRASTKKDKTLLLAV